MRVEPHGPRTAEYAIVGEAPGSAEAREGRPFVGPSGDMMRTALIKAGLDPDSVYWTNVVKEYKPGNPTPTNDEIQDALPELADELKALPNLKHVLVVGNVPMQALSGRKGGILKTQGTLLEPRKIMEGLKASILPIMHPAYVLRNNNYQTQNLFQEIVGSFVSQGQEAQAEEIILVRDAGKAMAWLEQPLLDHTRAAIDIEATPVPWWHEDFKLISAAIAFDGTTAYVVDLRDPGLMRWFQAWVGRSGIRWVMHNGAYDRQALLSKGMDLELMFDTMTAQYIIDPNSRKGLQYLSSMYLGLPPYKDVDYNNILDEPWEKVAEMNGKDAIRTWRLFEEKLMPMIRDDARLNRLMQFVMLPAINALLEMELKGMPIDTGRLADVTEGYEARMVQIADTLRNEARKVGMNKFNPKSVKDLNELMFGKLGLPVVKRTATGNPSLDKEARLALRGRHPAMDTLDEYKVVSQRLGTFLYPWAEQERDGYLHTKYKPNHVVSGRLSSEKPNMQQVPNDPDIRSVMGGLPGHKLVMLDYSQLELRLAANFAKEPTMLQAYRDGLDLHTRTAERVLGDPKGRQVGKILNFSLLYGAGWRMLQSIAWLQYQHKLTDEQAQALHQGFFRAYPRLSEWHKTSVAQARVLGYTQSPIGRRRYLPNIENMMDSKARAHDEKVALNHPVQSLGSDLMLMSLTEMHRQGFRVAATVHDSVILLAEDAEAEEVGKQAKEIMETIDSVLRTKFGYTIDVPLVADLTIATHWQK